MATTTMPSGVSTGGGDEPRPGRIARPTDWRLQYIFADHFIPKVLENGPVTFARPELRLPKVVSLHSFICRGQDAAAAAHTLEHAVFELVQCIHRLQPAICRQYFREDMDFFESSWELTEQLVLDGCFVIELFLSHREARVTEAGSWRPSHYRHDLVIASNQIPYFVLEELFLRAKLPELSRGGEEGGGGGGRATLLRNLAISYLIGNEAHELLRNYHGPIYHLLHLLHLHFSFSLQGQRPQRRPPLLRRLLRRSEYQKAKRQVTSGKTAPSEVQEAPTGSSEFQSGKPASSEGKPGKPASSEGQDGDAPGATKRRIIGTSLWSYKEIPKARDLASCGIRLWPKDTHCLADVTFRDGVVEIPAMMYGSLGFDCHLLVNLVALEAAPWWPVTERPFMNHAMFMSELISDEEDARLMQDEGVLRMGTGPGSSLLPSRFFYLLAETNAGGAPSLRRFTELADYVNQCYNEEKKWNTSSLFFC